MATEDCKSNSGIFLCRSRKYHVLVKNAIEVCVSSLCVCLCISIHVFSVHVKTFPSCSHTTLISHPFLLYPSFSLWFLFIYSTRSLHCSPLFFLPLPLPSSPPLPFPRPVSQALSFLCVQLSVRGFSTPHAFLEWRRVKRLTHTLDTQRVATRCFTQWDMIHDIYWTGAGS